MTSATCHALVKLDAGAHVDETDEDGSTALIAAAWSGQPNVVELLLSRGAKLEAKNTTVSNLFALAA